MTDRDVLVLLLGVMLLWLALLTERISRLDREAVRMENNAVVVP